MNDPKAQFSRIYDQYIDKIYRFIYLKVESSEVAEDISSKVFLKGWESYQKNPNLIKNVGAFLYQISRNMVIDHYRERGKATTVSEDYHLDTADHRVDIHQKAVLSADIEAMKLAIKNIDKDHQDVIILHYLEDMPFAQIAEVLNKSEGSVRVMAHRGLKSLRKELIQES